MSTSRKLGLIVGGALFLVGVVLVMLYSPDTTPEDKPPPVRPAKTAVVQSAGESVARTFTGSVIAQDQVDMSFRVSGPLIELPVQAGTAVKEGDLLAQIDPRDFQTRVARISGSLDQARAQLTAMKAGARAEDIRILENTLSAATSRFENARVEEERFKRLLEGGTVSKSEYDAKKLALDVAREAVEAAREDLAKGKAGARQEDVEAQEAQIRGLEAQLKEARDAVEDTSLRAPFDGRVAKRYVENFQDVRAKERIVSVQNMATVRIVADVPEAVAATVSKEDIEKITVRFETDESREYEATIDEIELEADRRTRTYAVTLSMPRPEDRNVLPGMSASVQLYLNASFQAAKAGIPVPADALFTDAEGASFVWTVGKDLTVSRRPVEIAGPTGDYVLVKSGLQGGERIVTAGVHMIQEGWTIRLLDDEQ